VWSIVLKKATEGTCCTPKYFQTWRPSLNSLKAMWHFLPIQRTLTRTKAKLHATNFSMANFFSSVRFGPVRCVVAIFILWSCEDSGKVVLRLSSSETETAVVAWKLVTHNVWKKCGENLEIIIKLQWNVKVNVLLIYVFHYDLQSISNLHTNFDLPLLPLKAPY